MRRILVLALVAATACTLPGARLERGEGILGSYVVNGVDPNGFEYTGLVNITPDGDDVILEWVVTGAIHRGRGFLDDDILRVTWETIEGPRSDATGTAVYDVLDDGRLIGTRSIDGLATSGEETLFPDP